MWKRYPIYSDSPFFPIYSKVIKQVPQGKEDITITTINKDRSNKVKSEVKEVFKFVFDYQDDDESICGVEVYKQIKGENDAE